MMQSSARLQHKVALITGGATGIGLATARLFAQEGAAVAIAGLATDPLIEKASEIQGKGAQTLALPCDLSRPDEGPRLIRETVGHFGALHILFNNAADTRLDKTVEEMSLEEWDYCLNVSLRAVLLLSKFAAPEMKRAGVGSIINTGSVGALMPWRGGAGYCAAKSGLLALTRVLAIEYGPWNIRVNTLSPGAVRTPNLERAIERNRHEQRLISKSALGRIGAPEEIARAALFLASDDSSFVTASNLIVDGGYLTI